MKINLYVYTFLKIETVIVRSGLNMAQNLYFQHKNVQVLNHFSQLSQTFVCSYIL